MLYGAGVVRGPEKASERLGLGLSENRTWSGKGVNHSRCRVPPEERPEVEPGGEKGSEEQRSQ